MWSILTYRYSQYKQSIFQVTLEHWHRSVGVSLAVKHQTEHYSQKMTESEISYQTKLMKLLSVCRQIRKIKLDRWYTSTVPLHPFPSHLRLTFFIQLS